MVLHVATMFNAVDVYIPILVNSTKLVKLMKSKDDIFLNLPVDLRSDTILPVIY